MSQQREHLYEFGPFRLDATRRSLLRDGQPCALPPKALEMLLALIENSGRVLERRDLMKRVWPGAVVDESNLVVTISLLRKVLGERASGGQYIETVPRRGYRFLARVRDSFNEPASEEREVFPALVIAEGQSVCAQQEVGQQEVGQQEVGQAFQNEAECAPPLPELTSQPLVRRASTTRKYLVGLITRHSMAMAIALAGALAGFAALALYAALPGGATSTRTPAEPRRLAILPFRNLKPDAETDFLGFSLANEVITKLDIVNSVAVCPSSYIDKYRYKEVEPKKAADELNVDILLTATYLKQEDNLRISVQLIDVSRNEILLKFPLDIKYDRLLTVHDEVAQKIIYRLNLRLTADESRRLNRDRPQDSLAYEYYLRGVDLFYSANKFPAAIDMLEKSVELDPSFALAWAHLGAAHTTYASLQFGGKMHYLKAQAAYEQALALNPEQFEAQIFMAVLLTDGGRVEQAIPLLREALQTKPNHAQARWLLSYAYRFAGLLGESIEEGERALELGLKVGINSPVFNTYLYAGLYDKFIKTLPPTDEAAYIVFYRGLGYYYLKDKSRAAADFNLAYELDPSLLQAQIGKSFSYALAGENRKGIELLRDTEKSIKERGVSDTEGIYKIVQAYAALGEKRAAVRVLRDSIEGGFFCYPYFVSDPILDSIRGEPEYAALMDVTRKRHEEFKRTFF